MIIFLLNTVFTLLCLWGPVMSDVLLSRLIPSQNMQAAAECREHQARPEWLMLVKIFLYTDTSTFIKLGRKKLPFTIHSQSNDGCN